MAVAITGSFAIAAAKLQRMVAASPTFQAARAVDNLDDALAFVFLKEAIGTTPRPYAVVSPGQNHDYVLVAGGSYNLLRPKGGVYLYLTADTSPEFFNDSVQADFEAASFFGSITDDIVAIAGADDQSSPWEESHLPIVGGPTLVAFGSNPEGTWQSLGRFYTAVYNVLWGDG